MVVLVCRTMKNIVMILELCFKIDFCCRIWIFLGPFLFVAAIAVVLLLYMLYNYLKTPDLDSLDYLTGMITYPFICICLIVFIKIVWQSLAVVLKYLDSSKIFKKFKCLRMFKLFVKEVLGATVNSLFTLLSN